MLVHDDLFCHVALLLSAMVVPSDSLFFWAPCTNILNHSHSYGHSPEQVNVSTLIPIPKGCNVNSADSKTRGLLWLGCDVGGRKLRQKPKSVAELQEALQVI